MYSNNHDFFNDLTYYSEDPDTHTTHLKLQVADPNFGLQGDLFQLTMKDELGFCQDSNSFQSTNYGVTDFDSHGLGATGLDNDLKQLVDPLLARTDSFPLHDYDITNSADLDIALQLDDSLDIDGLCLEEELLDLGGGLGSGLSGGHDSGLSGGYGSSLGQVGPALVSGPDLSHTRRPRRSSRAAAAAARVTMSQVIEESGLAESEPQYPTLAALGLEEDDAPRQRQPKVSYSTLTPQQKHQRIRQLNNTASRQYRGRKTEREQHYIQLESQQQLRHQQLLKKEQGLQQLRDNWEIYAKNFMKEHMGGGGGGTNMSLHPPQ